VSRLPDVGSVGFQLYAESQVTSLIAHHGTIPVVVNDEREIEAALRTVRKIA
jgi:hypothetical protein